MHRFTLSLAAASLVLGCGSMQESQPVSTTSAPHEQRRESDESTLRASNTKTPAPGRTAPRTVMTDDVGADAPVDALGKTATLGPRSDAKPDGNQPVLETSTERPVTESEIAAPSPRAGEASGAEKVRLSAAVKAKDSSAVARAPAKVAQARGRRLKKRGPAPKSSVAMGDAMHRRATPPPPADEEMKPTGASFEGRAARINAFTRTASDPLSTFAIDVDTAAYSIARRTLNADRMPTASLVRVEELVNYFAYDYEAPKGAGELFSVQADGALSPVDSKKALFRVGIQAKNVSEDDRMPANLVFLVDTSCSMRSSDKLGLTKASLKEAVSHLDERDQVAITTYAGGVRLVLPPTRGDDHKRINRAIDKLRSSGGTAMSSGLELAYSQASKMLKDGEISRIIVCSDGDANIGATTPSEILSRISGYVSEGVTLSTIGFGQGNYKDSMMEQLANKGNGNYYYIDSLRQAKRVFGRDLTKMLQDVAQDVKIQVEFDDDAVESYRLVGYENRNVADRDFRNDKVDAGEIGAGHQVTALYELVLRDNASGKLATVRVRAKKPRGMKAKEISFDAPVRLVTSPFGNAPADFRFAAAVMGGSELLRNSPHAEGWSYSRVISIIQDTAPFYDEDRAEFLSMMNKAAWLSGEQEAIGMRQ